MLRHVDPKNVMDGFVDADFEAVVEECELFEVFGALKRGRDKVRDLIERFGSVSVDADVFEVGLICGEVSLVVRNGCAGKVEGVAIFIGHDFGDMRRDDLIGVGDLFFQGPDVGVFFVCSLEQVFDDARVDERFVGLPVDEDVGVDEPCRLKLCQPHGAGGAVDRGHVIFSAERFDDGGGFWGVDGKGDRIKVGDLGGSFPDSLD